MKKDDSVAGQPRSETEGPAEAALGAVCLRRCGEGVAEELPEDLHATLQSPAVSSPPALGKGIAFVIVRRAFTVSSLQTVYSTPADWRQRS